MYTGYQMMTVSDMELSKLYQTNYIDSISLLNNEYSILVLEYNEDVKKPVVIKQNNNEIELVPFKQITSPYLGVIKPRNIEQYCAFDMLLDNKTKIKVLTGCYGSGKDFAMTNAAFQLIHEGYYNKIVYVRNNIEVRDTIPLGALPGGEFDKLLPFAMPLADHVGGVEGLVSLIEQNKVEIQHLGYIRGRDIKNSIIYCSEAENLTTKHVQLLLGRVGEGSAIWLNGDNRQTDKEVFNTNAGLKKLIDTLKGHHLFGYVHLKKSERSEVAALADLLDE